VTDTKSQGKLTGNYDRIFPTNFPSSAKLNLRDEKVFGSQNDNKIGSDVPLVMQQRKGLSAVFAASERNFHINIW
jgi:hypothetical protein